MKHTAILQVANKRMRSIGNYYKIIKEDCTIEHIHELRLEVKKLRAFLALVNTAQPGKMPLSIHPQVKRFYDLSGELRNLQLQQQRIVLVCNEQQLQSPVNYLQYLYDKQEVIRHQLQEQPINAGHVRRLLLHELPATIPQKAIDRFAENKALAIDQLMSLPVDDNTLHEIRKQYKDVLYNLKYLSKRQTIACEIFSSNREEITAITNSLGDYHDLYTALMLIWYYRVNTYNSPDGAGLKMVEESFLKSKAAAYPGRYSLTALHDSGQAVFS